MKEDKYFEEKISRALEAIKHPENFTDEELRKLLNVQSACKLAVTCWTAKRHWHAKMQPLPI